MITVSVVAAVLSLASGAMARRAMTRADPAMAGAWIPRDPR